MFIMHSCRGLGKWENTFVLSMTQVSEHFKHLRRATPGEGDGVIRSKGTNHCFRKCRKRDMNHTWEGAGSRYGLEILLDRVYMKRKKRGKLEPNRRLCTMRTQYMRPWQAQQLSKPKKCHGPWRMNIFILTQCKYLVNIHPNGTGYSMGTVPNLQSTTLKSATEKQGCLNMYHFVLSVILIPFLLSLLFPLSPTRAPALIPAHLDCCFGFLVDFPGLQSRPLRPSCKPQLNRSPYIAPQLTVGPFLLVSPNPQPAPLGPPQPASDRFLFFYLHAWLLWLNVRSTHQKKLWFIPASAHTVLHNRKPSVFPATPLNPTEVRVCAVTCWVKLRPPTPVHCSLSLWELFVFWLFIWRLLGALQYWLSLYVCICPNESIRSLRECW